MPASSELQIEPEQAIPPCAGLTVALSPAGSFGLLLVFALGLAAFGLLDTVPHNLTLHFARVT